MTATANPTKVTKGNKAPSANKKGSGKKPAGKKPGQAAPQASTAPANPDKEHKGEATAVATKAKPKADKATSEKKPKKLSLKDAAAKVLTNCKEGRTCGEMVKLIKERGLWNSTGLTPERTLSADLDRDIAKHGAESRFQKVGKGLYLLNG